MDAAPGGAVRMTSRPRKIQAKYVTQTDDAWGLDPSSVPGLSGRERRALGRWLGKVTFYVTNPLFDEPSGQVRAIVEQRLNDAAIPDAPQLRLITQDDTRRLSIESIDGRFVRLSREQDDALFLALNHARFEAAQVRREMGRRMAEGRPVTAAVARELLAWHERAQDIRATLFRFHYRLVYLLMRRRSEDLRQDLESLGWMQLLRAVDFYAAPGGVKFSTYAFRYILNAFKREMHYLGRAPVVREADLYANAQPQRGEPTMASLAVAPRHDAAESIDRRRLRMEVRRLLRRNTAHLSDPERTVVGLRFGLAGPAGQEHTLAEIGELLGVTRQRVHQLIMRSINKLRPVFERHPVLRRAVA